MHSTTRRWRRQRGDATMPLFDPATSTAAAKSVAHARAYMESRILGHLESVGEHGATSEETAHALDLRIQTASARFSELGDARRIVKSGRTRATSSGRQAVVWLHPSHAAGGPACPAAS